MTRTSPQKSFLSAMMLQVLKNFYLRPSCVCKPHFCLHNVLRSVFTVLCIEFGKVEKGDFWSIFKHTYDCSDDINLNLFLSQTK